MTFRKRFSQKFGMLFRRALKDKYNKIPSANFIAIQFNLRADGVSTITPETARKWINGLCIPELERFYVLKIWINLNPAMLFDENEFDDKNTRSFVNDATPEINQKLDEIKRLLNK